MKPYRTLIIEDEEDAVQLLTTLINNYCPEIEVIGIANDVETGIKEIKLQEPDLIFLDVSLGDEKCFEILDKFPNPKFGLVFTTAYPEYAFNAFQYDAMHYMLKPYAISEIRRTIDKIKELRPHEAIPEFKPKIILPQLTGNISIFYDDILYFEAERAYCRVFLKDTTNHFLSKPLAHFEQELLPNYFIRTHISYLVNIKTIKTSNKIQDNTLYLNNGIQIPISRRKFSEIKKYLTT